MAFPIDIKYIRETEHELGVQFPDAFKSKMIKDNGSELIINGEKWELYPFFDKSDRKRIARTCNHIALETKKCREIPYFPSEGTAIGRNGYGDQLILMPSEAVKSVLKDDIFIWLHETGENRMSGVATETI